MSPFTIARQELRRRAADDFLNLFDALGCRRRGMRLHCPFHDDRTPSASVYRGRFYCFVCDLSLDAFEFVQRIQGVDFRSALLFLAERYGMKLTKPVLTKPERNEFANRFRAAEIEAGELVAWRARILTALREARDIYLAAYHHFLRLILRYSLDHPSANFWADVCEFSEAKYQDFDEKIATLESASYSRLLPFFRRRRA